VIRSIFGAIIFLAVTIVLSIISIPAALFDRGGRSYLWLARLWSKSFLFFFSIKLSVIGLENITPKDHYVYVANHSSYTDIPILLAAIPFDIRGQYAVPLGNHHHVGSQVVRSSARALATQPTS